jgi:hypothetical protein
MIFPTWQVVIASISLFILVVALVALFCFRESKTSNTNDVESGPTAAGVVKIIGKLSKAEEKISNTKKKIDSKKAAVVKAKDDATKVVDKVAKTADKISKTAESTKEEVGKKLRPGAPKLPAQRPKVEVASA